MRKKVLSLMLAMSLSISMVTPIVIQETATVVNAASTEENVITDTETIKLVQEMLNCIGYDCGTPDGIAGNNTKNTIIKYQNSKGLNATGNITSELLVSLYADVKLVLDYGIGTHEDVLDALYDNNDNCTSASQQAANGAYKAADMLVVITKGLDKISKYQNDIEDAQLTKMLNDSSCSSAPQQEINGLYRIVELLGVWAKELDTGSNLSDIEDTLTSLTTHNASCSKTPQQAVNGSYRAVELLNIIAKELDTGKYSSDIASVILSWYDNDSTSTSAVQQEVNGLYTCVKLLNIIASEKDLLKKNSSRISTVMSTFSTNDSSCEYAPQQVVNGYYRMTELLYIIADMYD